MDLMFIRLYCGECKGYREINADEVAIMLDLEENKYIFSATCPDCYNDIKSTRKAFYENEIKRQI